MAQKDYETSEGVGIVGGADIQAEDEHDRARRLHHLATADPEPERDGTMTGPAHEEKYGLERAEASAAYWRAVGVHPTENRALRPGEDGYENTVPGAVENAAAEQPAAKATPAKGENA